MIRAVLGAALVAAATLASAQAQDDRLNSQQERMKTCNGQARERDMKGDERRAFMSQCLKGESGQLTAQQEKMRTCNREAGDQKMKGEQRRSFMKRCLSGGPAAAGR